MPLEVISRPLPLSPGHPSSTTPSSFLLHPSIFIPRLHPCVPRFVDVANFSPSLNPILPLLPCRLLSIFSRRPRHHLSLGRIPFLRYPSRRFLPSKILDSNLSEIRFFHFFTSMIGEIWIESEGAIIRECKRLCTCVREKEKNQKVIPFFFFFPLSLSSRDEMVWNVFERSGQAPKMVKSNVTFVVLAFRTLGGLPWGARPEPGSIRTRAIIESIMFHSDVPLFFLPLHLLSLRPCDGVSPLPGGGYSLDSQLL